MKRYRTFVYLSSFVEDVVRANSEEEAVEKLRQIVFKEGDRVIQKQVMENADSWPECDGAEELE